MRLLFLVDVQNLFYAARDAYGIDARIDFKLLREEAIANRPFTSVKCIAYLTSFKERDDIKKLLTALGVLSYEARVGKIRQSASGVLCGTDMDVELATEAITLCDEYEVIVVASGDGDLVPCYRVIKNKGKRVEILVFPGSLSQSIKDGGMVDDVRYLGKGVLFKNGKEREKEKDQTTKVGVGIEVTDEVGNQKPHENYPEMAVPKPEAEVTEVLSGEDLEIRKEQIRENFGKKR